MAATLIWTLATSPDTVLTAMSNSDAGALVDLLTDGLQLFCRWVVRALGA